jgi:hypothetical protein
VRVFFATGCSEVEAAVVVPVSVGSVTVSMGAGFSSRCSAERFAVAGSAMVVAAGVNSCDDMAVGYLLREEEGREEREVLAKRKKVPWRWRAISDKMDESGGPSDGR